MKSHEQFAVQPHSQGALYPAIIGMVEHYRPDGRLDFRSWFLLLDGHREEYASYEDAAAVARGLLADSTLRASWRARAPSQAPAQALAPVKSGQSPAYGRGFDAYAAPRRPFPFV